MMAKSKKPSSVASVPINAHKHVADTGPNIPAPFDLPKSGKLAVKVINHFRDEALKVYPIPAIPTGKWKQRPADPR